MIWRPSISRATIEFLKNKPIASKLAHLLFLEGIAQSRFVANGRGSGKYHDTPPNQDIVSENVTFLNIKTCSFSSSHHPSETRIITPATIRKSSPTQPAPFSRQKLCCSHHEPSPLHYRGGTDSTAPPSLPTMISI